jgi:hypothetical protein
VITVQASAPAAPPAARDLFWAHAAAFGAFWGTLEITLGSFLHTLRLPFTGALLAALGAGLLVAARQLRPARGGSLAAAGIAALCKSLSPGGVIFGPMVGILLEGALVELALLPAPRARLGAAVAGALAALMAGTQKFVVQFLFYGGTLFELYVALLRRAGEWLGAPDSGFWIVAALLGLLALLGALGGLLGWKVGRDAAALLDRQAAGQVA